LPLASFSGSASPDNATAGQTWTTGCIATRVRAVGLQAAAASAPPLLPLRTHRELRAASPELFAFSNPNKHKFHHHFIKITQKPNYLIGISHPFEEDLRCTM
jgi:hypothetical protein